MKVLIKNTILKNKKQDILIENGLIKEISTQINDEKASVFLANGNTILPGLVDVHVHFREPGFEYKETIQSGTKAAANGGFTSVIAMPNLNPVPDDAKKFAQQIKKNKENSVIKTYQFAPISNNLISDKTTNMREIAKYLPKGFTNDGHGVQTAKTMLDAMYQAKKLNLPIVAHIEDESLVNNGVLNKGYISSKLHLNGIDKLSEISQLARDLALVKATNVHYHVAHISTKESVELVRQAKKEGLNVTAEITPHHLLLDESMIKFDNPMMKMNPPLRTKADRLACIGGLLDGTIDMIATDHAPHSVVEKSGSMKNSAFGIVGIETSFALMYSHFVKSGLVDLETLINWMAKNPADIFNLNAGELKVGSPADLTIVDLKQKYEIKAENFVSKGVNSPFIGEKVYGEIIKTMVDGKFVNIK